MPETYADVTDLVEQFEYKPDTPLELGINNFVAWHCDFYKVDQLKNLDDAVVAIIGLGYVGLPLAVEFGKKYKTIGFDLSETKIASYKRVL